MAKMKNEDLLDQLFPDDEIDIDDWEKRTNEKREAANKKTHKDIQTLLLRKAGDKAVVNFLSEGRKYNLYFVTDYTTNHQAFYRHVLQLPTSGGDPLSRSGVKATEQGVYAVVNWSNIRKKKDQSEYAAPEVQLLIRGQLTVKLLEKRKRNSKQGNGTLLNKKWELERIGAGAQTAYDPTVDDDFEPDFDKTIPLKTEQGTREVFAIGRPDWPEYDTSFPIDKQSIYTQRQMKPDHEMDWNDPEMVDLWIKLHFLNTPLADYERLAKVQPSKNGKSSWNDAAPVPAKGDSIEEEEGDRKEKVPEKKSSGSRRNIPVVDDDDSEYDNVI